VVNFMGDGAWGSDDCAPYFDTTSGGEWCNLRTAVDFCQDKVVGEHRCIITIPAGTVQLGLGDLVLDDNGRSLVIRGDTSASTWVENTSGGDSRFLYINFASDHSSTTEVVLEKVTVAYFSTTGGWGGAAYVKYLKRGSFSDVNFYDNRASYGAGMYTNSVDNITFTDCVFDFNTATNNGAGLYVLSEVAGLSATYINMLFDSNSADVEGG
jgi:hypothetical protein